MRQELLIVCRLQISVEGPFRIKGVLMFSREVMHKYIVDYNSYQLKCELDHYHCSLKFMSLYKICKTWLTNITIANLQCSIINHWRMCWKEQSVTGNMLCWHPVEHFHPKTNLFVPAWWKENIFTYFFWNIKHLITKLKLCDSR